MSSQVRLEIDTGNGNTATAAICGSLVPQHQPLYDIAFGGQPLDNFNAQSATDIARELDRAIDSLRRDRVRYQSLTPLQQSYRPGVLDFCIAWRDRCREHPGCTVYIIP